MRRALSLAVLAVVLTALPSPAEQPAPPPTPVLTADERGAGPFRPGQAVRIGVQDGLPETSPYIYVEWTGSAGGRVTGYSYAEDVIASIPRSAPSGRYALSRVVISAPDGPADYVRDGTVSHPGGQSRHGLDFSLLDIDVDNDAVDVAPRLISMPTGTAVVGPSGRVALDWGSSDDRAEQLDMYAEFRNESGSLSAYGTSFPTGRGTSTLQLYGARPGRYALERIELRDQAGGYRYYYPGHSYVSPDFVLEPHDLPLRDLVIEVVDEASAPSGTARPDGPRAGNDPPDASSLTPTAVSVAVPTQPVPYGRPTGLTGRVSGADGSPLVGTMVTVTVRRPDGSAVVAGRTRTDAVGGWAFSFTPFSTVTVEARAGAVTATGRLEVQRDVRLLPTTATARAPFTLTAVLAPVRRGATVQLERLLPTGTWLPVATATQDAAGRAAFSRTELLAGGATYRAVAPADEGHTAGTGTTVVDVR